MKLYVQNNGVYGCIVVIAKNEEDARKLMNGCYNYDENSNLDVYDLTEGFKFENLGDR